VLNLSRNSQNVPPWTKEFAFDCAIKIEDRDGLRSEFNFAVMPNINVVSGRVLGMAIEVSVLWSGQDTANLNPLLARIVVENIVAFGARRQLLNGSLGTADSARMTFRLSILAYSRFARLRRLPRS
jgi:hypothetical protein